MSDFEALRADIAASQRRHRSAGEHFRGQFVPYQRRGVMAIPAFKMAAGGDPAHEGRAQSLRLMAGAARFPVDAFFFDLEDAAPDQPAFKAWARRFTVEALLTQHFDGKVVAYRPNNIRTAYFEDDILEVIRAAGHRLHAVVIPKSESADEVADVARIIKRTGELAGLTRPLALEVLIESPRAFVQAQAIAAIPQVTALVFGAWDFARTLGAEVDPQAWLRDQATARQLLPIVAAAEGKDAVDAVTATLPVRPARPAELSADRFAKLLECPAETLQSQDMPPDLREQLQARQQALALAARDAADARALGFAGKWILHPDQIAPIQGAWAPSRERALQALALAVAYARSAREGSGAQRDGIRLADKAVVGADWWLVLGGLRSGVLTDADIQATGFSFQALQRSVASRDGQLG